MARKPKIAAPPGHRGCPKCEQVLPLTDPETGRAAFAANGYCRACERARVAAAKMARLAAMPASEPFVSSGQATLQERRTDAMLNARIAPFPKLNLPELPQCACCKAPPTQSVHDLAFCARCGYYVAACGRCVDHSFREFVPSLLGRPDPAPLPVVFAPVVPHYANRPRTAPSGLDEVDVDPDARAC